MMRRAAIPRLIALDLFSPPDYTPPVAFAAIESTRNAVFAPPSQWVQFRHRSLRHETA